MDPSSKDERSLFERFGRDRDPAVREQLVDRFLPLARQLASRYQRPGEPLDDLLQVASLGLLKAIDGFDAERATAFSSYAVPTILGELKRHFRDRGWAVRVPRGLQELSLRVDRAAEELSTELKHPPTPHEISERLGIALEDVLEALEAGVAHQALSLEAPAASAEEGTTLSSTLGAEDEGFDAAERRATIEELMRNVPVREREVLHLRFAEDLTQSEIAARVGVSQMQVSRMIRQALARMREAAT